MLPNAPPSPDAVRAASLVALEWPRVLEALGERLSCPYGPQALAALAPLERPGAARHAMASIDELKLLRRNHGALEFGSVAALEPLLERASRQGRLEARELADVLATQRAALRMRARLLAPGAAPGLAPAPVPARLALAERAEQLHPERALCDTLEAALTPTGELNERAFPALAKLRDDLNRRRSAVQRRLDGILRDERLANVFQDRIYTLRGMRYVLPVKADFKGQVPGIVHDISGSGGTLFIEPQSVVEDVNTLAVVERALQAEAERILRELSAQVGASAGPLRRNLAWLGALDLLQAQAILSEDYRGMAVEVLQEGVVDLRGMAHPLLLLESGPEETAAEEGEGEDGSMEDAGIGGGEAERAAPPASGAWSAAGQSAAGQSAAQRTALQQPTVRNDVRLGAVGPPAAAAANAPAHYRCIVLSGANTGGKTVLLKSVGLCALLARHGMHLPVQAGSRMDLFTRVVADIGDQQSLANSLSTFSAQIRFLSGWLPSVGPDTLVLLDEMLTGTEPAQGSALATAVLEHLLASGAATLVTTHFTELKLLAERHPGLGNASMAFDPVGLRPTFRFQMGLPGASYALHIARRYGLPSALVERAEQTMAARPAALDEALIGLQEQQRRLDEEQQAQQRRGAALERREARTARKESALAEREQAQQRRESGELAAEFRTARRRIAGVIRELQSANSLPLAGKVRGQLDALEQELSRGTAGQDAAGQEAGGRLGTAGFSGPAGPPPELTGLAPGTLLTLRDSRQPVTLEAVLDGGQRARVHLGSVRLEVARDDLLSAAPQSPRPRSKRLRRTGQGAAHGERGAPGAAKDERPVPLAISGADNTLDLRGMRLEEALEHAERFFDLCTVKHVSPVVIIHGHGTGRLKQGLRETLQGSPYVAAFRPGDKGEGQDGVTVVALDL